jgi:hypothetical protein
MVLKELVPAPIQGEMWGPGIRIPNEEIFTINLTGDVVVERLFNSHEVSKYTYTKFNPESTYPMDADQPYWWKEWVNRNELKKLSQEIVERTTTFETVFEGDEIVICDILGIGSQVELESGVIKQVKMLDLDTSVDDDPIHYLKKINLTSGVVLKTERSFHFYGFDLLGESEWKTWIDGLINLPDSERVFGSEYLPMCLERGYSALRIFGYDGTSKKEVPTIVARV